MQAGADISKVDIPALTKRTQNAGTEVVEAKAGAGSATLSMAYAAARMAGSCLGAMAGKDGVVECAFVKSDIVPGLDFFASRLRLGRDGIAEFLPLGELRWLSFAMLSSFLRPFRAAMRLARSLSADRRHERSVCVLGNDAPLCSMMANVSRTPRAFAGALSELEQKGLEELKDELKGSIQKGVNFVAGQA